MRFGRVRVPRLRVTHLQNNQDTNPGDLDSLSVTPHVPLNRAGIIYNMRPCDGKLQSLQNTGL